MIGSTTALFGSLLAQAAANPPIVAGGQIHSVWDFIVKGGPTMFVIALCSLVALTVIVERAIVLRRRYVIPPEFLAGLKSRLTRREEAIQFCDADGSPIANILGAALRRKGERRESVEKAAEEAGRREFVRLRHRMRLLGSLPQISTMLGLLGTIFGMIKTFQAIAVSGQSLGKTEMLAQGIFEAWTCTAAGLLVAIPVLIAYHTLMGRIDRWMAELDRVTGDWVELLRGDSIAAVAASIPSTPAVANEPATTSSAQAIVPQPVPSAAPAVAIAAGGAS